MTEEPTITVELAGGIEQEWSADRFARECETTVLTERQAKALFYRSLGVSREDTAELMDCGKSNVSDLDGTARQKIISASNTLSVVSLVDAEPEESGSYIGTCVECDNPTGTLKPDPRDAELPMEDKGTVCPSCHADLTEE